jgi:hypothetical protein
MGIRSLYLFVRRLLPAIRACDLVCSATIPIHHCRQKGLLLSIDDSECRFLEAVYVYYYLVPTSPQFEDEENGF